LPLMDRCAATMGSGMAGEAGDAIFSLLRVGCGAES
jgi:hypothetical protein